MKAQRERDLLFVLPTLIGVLSVASCATTASRPGSAPAITLEAGAILADEIRPIDRTAYDIVARLRPRFLFERKYAIHSTAPTPPVVYVDGARVGAIAELRIISAGSVLAIRYLSPGEAPWRLGPGHDGGAILVTTDRGAIRR